ncbi:MAG: HDOD domain-containing protein [Bacillota bacterium]|nr:HDOD domain-containing protein [Bacillota bacterium]
MYAYIARQPILNADNKVIAYELLFRNNQINASEIEDSSLATLQVIKNFYSVVGKDTLTDRKPAFINFDENLLKSKLIENLPKDIVIEILESVEPTEEIAGICKSLKENGYILALDDFEYHDKYKEILEYIDIIKVDFIITKGKERKRLIEKVNNNKIRYLAEKVETIQDYKEAAELGFTMFQGYYFCKPTVVTVKEINVYQFTYLKLIEELNKEEIDIEKIEKDIKNDLSLSYKLLMLVNSAYYGLKTKVTSIKKAIMLIGTGELKKWLYVITLKSINKDKPDEIVKMSLLRAYFGEMLVKKGKLMADSSEMFLTGLFSMIDVLTESNMEQVLKGLPISLQVKAALKGEENILKRILDLEISYEKADWEKVKSISQFLNLKQEIINKCYVKAIENLSQIIVGI